MPVRVSYKKQIGLLLMLSITFLIVVEVFVNIWLINFYKCDFENNEIFINEDEKIKRKICLESIGYGFSKDRTSYINGTGHVGGMDKNLVHVNSLGFRGHEITKEKPIDTYRIFIEGGSTTFGAGVLDNQTIPFYLQELYDKNSFEFNIQVVNAGWPGKWSGEEVEDIQNKIFKMEPDLIIVYDGWNELSQTVKHKNPLATGLQWKERWIGICKLSEEEGVDTLISLQPLVNTGKKILTEQESIHFLTAEKMKLTETYSDYLEQLDEINSYCTKTADLTGVFDYIQEPIFYDWGHTGPQGNRIIAENFYQLSLPLVIQRAETMTFSNNSNFSSFDSINSSLVSNDLDIFLDNSYYMIREIITPYKTPRIIPLIFTI